MNSTGVGFGSIALGLLMVLALGLAIYMFGAMIVARFRQGRVEEETTVSYPDQPQSAADRRAVERIERERGADSEPREQAVGAGRRVVPQTPDRIGERPVDADHDRGVAPRDANSESGDGGSRPRNPL